MKNAIIITIIILLSHGSVNAAKQTTDKTTRFKEFISGLTELKDGYQYKEYTMPSDLQHIHGEDYVSFNMVSSYDEYGLGIDKRYIIGYFKENNMFVLLTVSKPDGASSEENTLPELLLYNSTGEKISQIKLNRSDSEKKFINFTFQNKEFIRDYTVDDSIDIDEQGNSIPVKVQKKHKYFRIRFNNKGFTLQNEKNTLITLQAWDKNCYVGKIDFSNGENYKGKFRISNIYGEFEPDAFGYTGTYKDLKGKVYKGCFGSDFKLAPNLFLDNLMVNNNLQIKKGELKILQQLVLKNENEVFSIKELVLLFKVNQRLIQENTYTGTISNELLQKLDKADAGTNLYLDLRYTDAKGNFYHLPSQRIKIVN
jgi:hypothetical protein